MPKFREISNLTLNIEFVVRAQGFILDISISYLFASDWFRNMKMQQSPAAVGALDK